MAGNEDERSEIAKLCEHVEVVRLGLFGSAAHGGFSEAASDLDALGLFDRRAEPDVHRYLSLGCVPAFLTDTIGLMMNSSGRLRDTAFPS